MESRGWLVNATIENTVVLCWTKIHCCFPFYDTKCWNIPVPTIPYMKQWGTRRKNVDEDQQVQLLPSTWYAALSGITIRSSHRLQERFDGVVVVADGGNNKGIWVMMVSWILYRYCMIFSSTTVLLKCVWCNSCTRSTMTIPATSYRSQSVWKCSYLQVL